MMLPQNAKIVTAFPPQAGGAIAGDWVSAKNYHKAMAVITMYTGADDTEFTITVDKATNVAAGNESAGITLDNTWTLYNIAAIPLSDVMTKGATGLASVVTVTDQARTHLVVIDINTDELPTNLFNFDCLQLTIAGGNALHFIGAVWVLYEPRYAQEPMPIAIAD